MTKRSKKTTREPFLKKKSFHDSDKNVVNAILINCYLKALALKRAREMPNSKNKKLDK
jgi:hypothetical protein